MGCVKCTFPGADKILLGSCSCSDSWIGVYGAHLRMRATRGLPSLTVIAAPSLLAIKRPPMITTQKKLLRIAMKEKRARLFQENPDAGDKVSTLFFENFDTPAQGIVGSYWPLKSELDIRPLVKKLMEKGVRCALPRITPQGLDFHLWTESSPLVKGLFHVLEPSSTAERVVPDILLVPLLAFDKQKHRLGYGQGHFDRYLHQHPVLTIGIGFKGQEIEEIPAQPHDFALDHILTEEGVFS